MRTVLVAGATGFLGKRLLEHSFRSGDRVVALTRPESVSKLDDSKQFISDVRVAELSDRGALAAAMRGVDAVVSTVGMTKPAHGMDPDTVDFGGNMALLAAATDTNVGHFSYVSLDGVELPGADDIAVIRAKRRFEDALRQASIDWAIARPNGFFWNYGIYLSLARDHGVMRLVGNGEAQTTPIDEGELARAIIARIGEHQSIYSVGGPQDLTFNEVAELIGQALGKTIKVHHYSQGATTAALKMLHPFSPTRADLLQMFVWLLNAGVTSDHVGTATLSDWLREHRDSHFSV